jgi:hypothetical protein
VHAAAAVLVQLVHRYRCTAIAAEAMSFNPAGSSSHSASVCRGRGRCIGHGTGGLELYELPPRRWGGAILGRTAKTGARLTTRVFGVRREVRLALHQARTRDPRCRLVGA